MRRIAPEVGLIVRYVMESDTAQVWPALVLSGVTHHGAASLDLFVFTPSGPQVRSGVRYHFPRPGAWYTGGTWHFTPDTMEADMAIPKTPHDDGFELGAALAATFNTGTNRAAAYALGKRFAKLLDYRDMDSGMEFVDGFTAGVMGEEKDPKLLGDGAASVAG